MKRLKVITVVGTRPEIIRLSRIIPLIDEYCDHVLVHTGQNYDYELNEIFFNELNVRSPDYFLSAAGKTSSETIGNIIIKVDKMLSSLKPDAILVLGDTNSCMAVLPAKRHKIPIFHMEAGNRCFDMRVPEEINRRIVDHIADINLTYSSIARDYLINEGLPAERVIKIGSPMFEVIEHQMQNIRNSDVLRRLDISKQKFFLMSVHREENLSIYKNFNNLKEIMNGVAEEYELPLIVSTHPRTKKKLDETETRLHKNVKLLKPLGFLDYTKLQLSAKVVISDSGTISEESSILNIPAINLREVHERPEAMEETSVIMTGLEIDRVKQAIELLANQPRGEKRGLSLVKDYSVPNVSEKVLRILYSYRDYVMKTVWKEY